MAKLTRKTLIGVKSETTQGSAVTLATASGSDFLMAIDVEIKPTVEILERNYYRNSFDRVAHVTGKQFATVSFKTEVKTAGSANTPTDAFKACLLACGFTDSTGTFTQITDNVSGMQGPATSATIDVYKDGIKHQIVGCVGNVKFNFKAGEIAYAEFNFSGIETTSATANPSVTFESNTPLILESASLSLLGGSSFVASDFSFDCANTITQREDVSSANGIKGFIITGRNPKGSCNFEVVDEGEWTKFKAGTSGSTSLTLGTGTGTTIVFTMPYSQYAELSYADKSGILGHSSGLVFNGSTGNDWISINFN